MVWRSAFVAAVAAVLLTPAIGRGEMRVDERLAAGQPPVVISHRSVRLGGFPENSLAGIGHAIDHGIEMVQINPQMTRDGQYVLMHDPTLNRTTDVEAVFPDGPPLGPTRASRGGRDYVRDYRLEDIRRLRLTDGDAGGLHRVPTLDEALELIDGRMLVMLGLKAYDTDSLAAVLRARDRGNLVLFDIFYADASVLHDIAAATGIAAAVSLSESRDYRADIDRLAAGVGPALTLVVVDSNRLTPAFVARAAELGISLCLSGMRGGEDSALIYKSDPAPWLATLQSGAAAVLTAQPEAVMELLQR